MIAGFACMAVLAVGLFVDPGHAAGIMNLHQHLGLDLHGSAGVGIGLIGLTTGKVALRSVEEFMTGYKPIYPAIYPLFLGNSQAYSEEAGKIDFKRINTVGDIRAKHITPKDTEIRQIAVNEASKTFKKYFLANQFTLSALQDRRAIEDVVAQVLDEHQKQMDELFLLGEGTSTSTMVNNGLFWSNDPNYVLNASPASVSDADDLHTAVMESVAEADAIAGRKVIIFYGEDTLPIFDSVYESSPVPFKKVLAEVLGENYTLVKLPSAVTPSAANGWIIANLDQIKLHYTILPQLKARGVNDEKGYLWHNFMLGSMMLEVLQSKAVIRQPCTFA